MHTKFKYSGLYDHHTNSKAADIWSSFQQSRTQGDLVCAAGWQVRQFLVLCSQLDLGPPKPQLLKKVFKYDWQGVAGFSTNFVISVKQNEARP